MTTPLPDRPDVPAFVATLGALDGRLVRPADTDWDDVRGAWQLAVDQRPAAVVQVGSARDVQAVVRAAAATGLRVAAQATGHNATPLGPLDDTVLLRTGGLDEVTVDPDTATARIGAGTASAALTAATAPHGLASAFGTAPGVGVVGYLLGGGVSWFGRSRGLAANGVLALEVVTADGRLRRVDHDHDPDLFWALRGGGGTFGVVTAVELRLFPLTQVVGGALWWPVERAAEVLHAWQGWSASLPDEVTSIGRLLSVPSAPGVPAALAGRTFVQVDLVSLVGTVDTDRLLTPLRAHDPLIDSVGPMGLADVYGIHMDPPGPVPATADGVALRELTPETIDALLATAGPGSPHLAPVVVEIRHYGGALARPAPDGGVVSWLASAGHVQWIGITPVPEAVVAAHTALDALRDALAPWADPVPYLNFAEGRDARVHHDEDLPRLRAIKAAVDPGDVIRANHPLPDAP